MVSVEAELALEWWRGGSDRSVARLARLVDHWLDVRAVADPESRAHAHRAALANRFPWEIDR